jgi:hypothetical protein
VALISEPPSRLECSNRAAPTIETARTFCTERESAFPDILCSYFLLSTTSACVTRFAASVSHSQISDGFLTSFRASRYFIPRISGRHYGDIASPKGNSNISLFASEQRCKAGALVCSRGSVAFADPQIENKHLLLGLMRVEGSYGAKGVHAPSPRATLLRFARNDAYPCGSGKKHKRCCGGIHSPFTVH